MTVIGSYYLKTHASQVIEAASRGESFLITVNGNQRCQITPLSHAQPTSWKDGFAQRCTTFSQKLGSPQYSQTEITSIIEEGRI